MKASNFRISKDYQGGWTLSMEVDDPEFCMRICDNLPVADVTIRKWSEHRSLDANALLWVLCSKIAESINSSKEDVYLQMLKSYGQSFVVKVKNGDEEKLRCLCKYAEPYDRIPAEDKARYWLAVVGSSNYSKDEMSKLLDGVVAECESMNLLFDREEVNQAKERWNDE